MTSFIFAFKLTNESCRNVLFFGIMCEVLYQR